MSLIKITIPNMALTDEQIIMLWKQGLTKYEVSQIYKNNLNKVRKKEMKYVRKEDALRYVENILYKEVISWQKA